jgi:hypothetical protein
MEKLCADIKSATLSGNTHPAFVPGRLNYLHTKQSLTLDNHTWIMTALAFEQLVRNPEFEIQDALSAATQNFRYILLREGIDQLIEHNLRGVTESAQQFLEMYHATEMARYGSVIEELDQINKVGRIEKGILAKAKSGPENPLTLLPIIDGASLGPNYSRAKFLRRDSTSHTYEVPREVVMGRVYNVSGEDSACGFRAAMPELANQFVQPCDLTPFARAILNNKDILELVLIRHPTALDMQKRYEEGRLTDTEVQDISDQSTILRGSLPHQQHEQYFSGTRGAERPTIRTYARYCAEKVKIDPSEIVDLIRRYHLEARIAFALFVRANQEAQLRDDIFVHAPQLREIFTSHARKILCPGQMLEEPAHAFEVTPFIGTPEIFRKIILENNHSKFIGQLDFSQVALLTGIPIQFSLYPNPQPDRVNLPNDTLVRSVIYPPKKGPTRAKRIVSLEISDPATDPRHHSPQPHFRRFAFISDIPLRTAMLRQTCSAYDLKWDDML